MYGVAVCVRVAKCVRSETCNERTTVPLWVDRSGGREEGGGEREGEREGGRESLWLWPCDRGTVYAHVMSLANSVYMITAARGRLREGAVSGSVEHN